MRGRFNPKTANLVIYIKSISKERAKISILLEILFILIFEEIEFNWSVIWLEWLILFLFDAKSIRFCKTPHLSLSARYVLQRVVFTFTKRHCN